MLVNGYQEILPVGGRNIRFEEIGNKGRWQEHILGI